MRSVVTWSLFVALIVGCGGATSSPLGTPDASVDVDAATGDAASSDAGSRTCGASGDGGRCVTNGVACGHCEAAGSPDDSECGAGFTCCHAVPFACADAGHDAGDPHCPDNAPVAGTPCSISAQGCLYDPKCPPGTGPIRSLSFSCTNGAWTDTLGPGPACEGPAPQDAGPSPNAGCTSTGGTVTSQLCCTSTNDFPGTCGVGACSCAPSSSHTIQVCQCAAGDCFDGKKCIPGGG